MRITTTGRYGLRAILDIAVQEDDKPVLRQEIAHRQEISAEYIAQIFRALINAGLVKSQKGPGGGYTLMRPPALISLGEILRALEGPFAAVPCVLPDNPTRCTRIDTCATHLVWVRLSQTIEIFLDSISLAELADQARQLDAAQSTTECHPLDILLESLPRPTVADTACPEVCP